MNITLWISQVLLALVFFYSGITKGFKSVPELVGMGQTGVKGLDERFVHSIGIAELFGVCGIILPWWLNIYPVLTPISAFCFALVMVFSTPIHYRQHNYFQVFTHITTLALAVFVGIARWNQLR